MINNTRGFTIVELLIVIVVIAILAAITIVSYNGITARANATNAKSAATNALKKAEAYNAELNGYPIAPANLTTAATTTTYNLTGVTFTTAATAPTTAPASPNVLQLFRCAGATGLQVKYWDYTSAAADKWTIQTTGTCTTPTYTQA